MRGGLQLLLEGKKEEGLAAAVRDLDSSSSGREGTPGAGPALFVHHQQQHQQQQYPHRRSSSVPLPNDYYPAFSGITLPSDLSSLPPARLRP